MKIYFLLVWLACVVGCNRAELPTKVIAERADQLYREYLTNELAAAKRNILETEALLLKEASESARDNGLYLAYARLMLLAEAGNDPNSAEIYYQKAVYWYIRYLEGSRLPMPQLRRKLTLFDRATCLGLTIRWDKDMNNGRPARFWTDFTRTVMEQGGKLPEVKEFD